MPSSVLWALIWTLSLAIWLGNVIRYKGPSALQRRLLATITLSVAFMASLSWYFVFYPPAH